jgi:VIT1/CCC1 family predicted Fe2+/Mn2+ transporter
MELVVLLALSAPLFYIVGLVTTIRWLVRQVRQPIPNPALAAAEPDENESAPHGSNAAKELRLRASKYDGDVKHELLAVADSLEGHSPDLVHDNDSAVARYEPGSDTPTHTHAVAHEHRAPSEPKPVDWVGSVTTPLHSMDNINLLLFLGAFLVVVSAGIFVGYNLQSLTGLFKTIFLGIFAALFYGVGLALYLQAPKLRPAGTTFTGIGLVLLPLVGLAAYNFTGAHNHGEATWFITSLVTFAAYVGTLYLTRQTYIAYLMAFTTLSLFESTISLFDVPVYWFGWVMGLVALLLMALSRWTGWWKDASQSLTISANLFIPISLLFSAVLAVENGSAQLGVTIAISGLFYAYLASRNPDNQNGEVYWLLGLLALPLSLSVGLWDHVPPETVAGILVGTAGAYLGGAALSSTRISTRWQLIVGTVAGLLPLAAVFFVLDDKWALLGCLVVAVLINAIFAWRLRQSGLSLIGILSALAIPFVALRVVPASGVDWGWVALAYLALAPVLLRWRILMKGWEESAEVVGAAGYLLALTAALLAAGAQGHGTLLLVGAAVSGALFWVSYFEQRTEFVYVSSAVKYLAALQIVPLTNWPSEAYALIVIVIGGASYAAGYVMTDTARGQALRWSAIAATLFGAIFASSTDSLTPIASLALGGALLWKEANRQQQPVAAEVGMGILMVSFHWLLSHYDVEQTQAYSLPWAAFAAYLTYRRRSAPQDIRDLFTGIALFLLTFPIAGQALGDANGAWYGLELILIAIGLVLYGASTNNKLIKWWGAGTLIIEVLYQMRDVLFALPKYLISAALGLALLGVAIYLLQRRKDH